MNAQVRRLATVVLGMFLVLAAGLTVVQYAQAPSLNADPRNSRSIYREYGRDRGPIVVAGQSVAYSQPVADSFTYQRTYSNGPLYAPVTGYYSVVFPSRGIEKTESDVLNGVSDSLFISRLQHLITGKQQKGGSVELTLDPAVQQAAWDALGDYHGAAVALDPRTGAILAMVTKPTYDPGVLAGHDTKAVNDAYQQLLDDPNKPLDNRAIGSDQYPPGSTFKLVTAAAALQSGKYTKDSVVPAPTEYQLPGSTKVMHSVGGMVCSNTGEMTIAQALAISCNTTFAMLGVQMGDDALKAQAEAFGFGKDLYIPLTVTPSRYPSNDSAALTAMAAIGEASVRATPLQMAMVASAIANKGQLMKPYLIDQETDSDLNVIQKTSPDVWATPISANTASQLKDMMIGVVNSGTGKRAQIPGVQVAGKTGTAQGDPGKPAAAAWFVGFAPADNPTVVVAVAIEGGGSAADEVSGSSKAAPIAKAILQAALK